MLIGLCLAELAREIAHCILGLWKSPELGTGVRGSMLYNALQLNGLILSYLPEGVSWRLQPLFETLSPSLSNAIVAPLRGTCRVSMVSVFL